MEKDPGLQLERTVLAWFRTLWLCLLIAVVILKYAFIEQSSSWLVGGTALVALCLLIFISGDSRARRFRFCHHNTTSNEASIKILISITVSIAAIAALVNAF
jgi:Ca2+/H+ antiporter